MKEGFSIMNIKKSAINLMLLSSAFYMGKNIGMEQSPEYTVAIKENFSNDINTFAKDTFKYYDIKTKPKNVFTVLSENLLNYLKEKQYPDNLLGMAKKELLQLIQMEKCFLMKEIMSNEIQGAYSADKLFKNIKKYIFTLAYQLSTYEDILPENEYLQKKQYLLHKEALKLKDVFSGLLSFLNEKLKEEATSFFNFLTEGEKFYMKQIYFSMYSCRLNRLIALVAKDIAKYFFDNNSIEAKRYFQSLVNNDKVVFQEIAQFNNNIIHLSKVYPKIFLRGKNNLNENAFNDNDVEYEGMQPSEDTFGSTWF